MAGIQEILNLRIYSDNLTIIGAINNKTLKKKILGIVKDIHLLASAFVSISFFHMVRKFNEEADASANSILSPNVSEKKKIFILRNSLL